MINWKRFDEKLVTILIIFGSAFMLAAALFFQEVMNLPPCILCKYQRVPYIFVIFAGALAYILFNGQFRKLALFLLFTCAIALFIDAGIAGFHVGVEHGWWEGTSECGGNIKANLSLEELRAAILNAPIVRCTEVAWQMFGISMAGYNMMIALAMAFFTSLSFFHFIHK